MSDVNQALTGLPMRELIAGPLVAAAQSQFVLAETALTFINKIGFENDKTRLLTFESSQPYIRHGKDSLGNEISEVDYRPLKVQAPLLGLVPLPSLLIEDISIDFQMEISTATSTKETDDKVASAEASAGWGPFKASVSGKVSSSRENTRSTNQTAKYNVRVNARQQQQTEGLSKLMDIMAACITPIDVK